MPTGSLRWYDPTRGRGAISLEAGGEMFVKLCPEGTTAAVALRPGDKVSFKSAMCEGLGRPVATSIAAHRPRPRARPDRVA